MTHIPLILSTILAKDIFHYFQIDKNFNIISYSYGIDKYFTVSQQIIGSDIRVYLPELLGSEEEILYSFTDENHHFSIEKIYKNDHYIDISTEYCDTESILVIMQDNTTDVKKQHELLQYNNELTLTNNILQSILDQKESLLFVADTHEIKFANKKFIEFLGKSDITELQEEPMGIYKDYNQDFETYDDIVLELSSNERGFMKLNGVDFVLEVLLLGHPYKLFTLKATPRGSLNSAL